MNILLDKLKGHIPENVLKELPDVMEKFGINTALRLSHFLSQCSHESSKFTRVRENLNYSAVGLKKTFKKYFPDNIVDLYAKKPEKIASRVYANRMGNGNELSREGFKYSGKGYIQLTGKDNYKAFGGSIGVDLVKEPDLVASKYPLLSAAWFFKSNGLNAVADLGATELIVTKMTKRINGGNIGLVERIAVFKKIYGLLK